MHVIMIKSDLIDNFYVLKEFLIFHKLVAFYEHLRYGFIKNIFLDFLGFFRNILRNENH